MVEVSGTIFKLPEVYSRDVLDLVEAIHEQGYSLKPVIELLNKRPMSTSNVIF